MLIGFLETPIAKFLFYQVFPLSHSWNLYFNRSYTVFCS